MLAAKRPVDTGRREELRRQNHAYYQPDSPHLQLLCDRKSHVDERLEALPPGDSMKFQRLNDVSLKLGNELDVARAARIKPETPREEVTLDGLIARAETVRAALLALRDGSPQPVDAPGLETTIVDDDEFILLEDE